MTNKEALVATLMTSVADSSLDLALINAGIDGAATYSQGDQSAIEVCAIPLLYGLYTQPDISEGGYSVNHPDFLRKIKERLLYLAKKNNVTDILALVEDKKPSVTGKSVW